jgi:hypothetical protein
MPRGIKPQCLVVLYHIGVLVESLVKVPITAITQGVTEMEDVEEGMREMMGMNMMVHLFHRHHQCPMSTRRRTRRRRQAMEGEEEMMILTRILMTVMRNLFDV